MPALRVQIPPGSKSVASLGLKSMQMEEEEEKEDDFPEHLRLIRDMYTTQKADGQVAESGWPALRPSGAAS